MKTRTSVALGLVTLTTLAAGPAASQELVAGAEVGLGFTSFRADEHDDRIDYETGLSAGLTAGWRFNEVLSVGTGLHWIRKGADGTVIGFEEALAVDLRLDYLQVPLLVSASLPTPGAFRPVLSAGPAVAFEVACEHQTEPSELALTLGCDDSGQDQRATTDWSFLLAGGVAWEMERVSVIVQGRYDVGLTRLDENGSAQFPGLRNRAFLLTTGLEWSIR
jgi:hypothetical protein